MNGQDLLTKDKLLQEDCLTGSGTHIVNRMGDEGAEESCRNLQALLEHTRIIREDERKRIASQLHDELGQAFTALKIDIKWLRNSIEINPEASEKLSAMENLLDDAMDKTRKIVSELKPALLEDFGFVEAVGWYFHETGKKADIAFNFIHEGSPERLSKESSLFIYQIIRELTTNVIRHANAKNIVLEMRRVGGHLEIIFSDDGIGITGEKWENPQSFGIYNMKERIKYWGGTADNLSTPGEGCKIRIVLPAEKVF